MEPSSRNLSCSIEYRIWQILYQSGWTIDEEQVPLLPVSGTDVPPKTYGISKGYPWVWWDVKCKNPSRQQITVYHNGSAIDPYSYVVDFKKARLTFSGAVPTGTLTIDVTHFACNLVNSYPTKETLAVTRLPLVAYQVTGRTGVPFSVGTPLVEYTYPIAVDVFALDPGQQQDMMDTLVSQLRQIALYDMTEAGVLGSDGDVNPDFNADLQRKGHVNMARVPGGRLLDPRKGATDKEKFRALVSLSVKNVQ